MTRSISSELPKMVGEDVLIKGWLHNVRDLGKIVFLILRDRGGLVQVTITEKEEIAKLQGLQSGSVIEITGTVAEAKTPIGVEIAQPTLRIIKAITEVPEIDISKDRLNLELDTLLDHRTVSLRHPTQQAIFKIQQAAKEGFRKAMQDRQFVEISSPKLIATASEGGTNFFQVPYFGGSSVYLAQSPQLYKQIMVGVFERVFEIGPVFRAEKHNTSRHMSEYVSLDAEMGFIDSWEEITELMTYAIKSIINYAWENYTSELELLGATKPLIDAEVPKLKIEEIHEIFFKETGEDLRGEPDLEPQEERFICEYSAREWKSDLVLATHFPTKKRPFYTYPSDENPEETYSADMLFRGLEIITGGQRINDYAQLLSNATKWGVDHAKIHEYLEAFRFGMPPEGGFGMGLERVTAKLISLDNVKEASLFPTDLKRAGGTKISKPTFKGGSEIRDAILKLLTEREIKFEHQEHEPTPTSADSARVRGTTPAEGVKALILRGKSTGKNYMLNLPGDSKADLKLLEEVVKEKLEMEKPEEILKRFGLQIGGVPPFGNLLGIETYMSEEVLTQEKVAFNCGLLTESVTLNEAKLLAEVTESIVGKFTKDNN